jgi:hypothetical protein
VGPELIRSPWASSHTYDRHVEMATPEHCLKRRENLLICQITGRAEENERVRMESCHF